MDRVKIVTAISLLSDNSKRRCSIGLLVRLLKGLTTWGKNPQANLKALSFISRCQASYKYQVTSSDHNDMTRSMIIDKFCATQL